MLECSMSRYDDLRRMRESRFLDRTRGQLPDLAEAIAEERKQQARRIHDSVTKNVTVNPPVTLNPVTINTPISVTPKPGRPRGRPTTGNPLSGAERTRRYRQRLKDART